MTITNFGSGEIEISDEDRKIRLDREMANRLIMVARMHTVAEFLEKLPALISDEALLQKIASAFEGRSSSERWGLKEKIARLQTLTKGYGPCDGAAVVETVPLALL